MGQRGRLKGKFLKIHWTLESENASHNKCGIAKSVPRSKLIELMHVLEKWKKYQINSLNSYLKNLEKGKNKPKPSRIKKIIKNRNY